MGGGGGAGAICRGEVMLREGAEVEMRRACREELGWAMRIGSCLVDGDEVAVVRHRAGGRMGRRAAWGGCGRGRGWHEVGGLLGQEARPV